MKFYLKIVNEGFKRGSDLYFFAEDGENITIARPVSLEFNKEDSFHYTEAYARIPTLSFCEPIEVITDFESKEFRGLQSVNSSLRSENAKLKRIIKEFIE